MVKKPTPKDWTRHDVLFAVRRTGTSLQRMSRELGYSRTALGNALWGPQPKYERLIAEFLGTTPQKIWPSRYHSDGSPKSGRGERGLGRYISKAKRNNNTVKNPCNVNGAA
jgi:Ner family transcriptional regulator